LSWKCTHRKLTGKMAGPFANPGYLFCTQLKESDTTWNTKCLSLWSHGFPSVLQHSTRSPSHTYYFPYHLRIFALHCQISTRTHPLSSPPSEWFRPHASKNFSRIYITHQNHRDYSHCVRECQSGVRFSDATESRLSSFCLTRLYKDS
jgi:hypothetical protein